jgi:hypothetical protein
MAISEVCRNRRGAADVQNCVAWQQRHLRRCTGCDCKSRRVFYAELGHGQENNCFTGNLSHANSNLRTSGGIGCICHKLRARTRGHAEGTNEDGRFESSRGIRGGLGLEPHNRTRDKPSPIAPHFDDERLQWRRVDRVGYRGAGNNPDAWLVDWSDWVAAATGK